MALAALRNKIRPINAQFFPILSRYYSLWEPDYLESQEPKIPLYSTLNIQIKGYDFPILEKFQSFIHNSVERMDMDVESSYAMPPKEMLIKRYKPKSTLLESEYKLNLYERNVQISNVTSTSLPLLVRILEASLPMGVTFVVENLDPSKELKRYVPDTELIKLKNELDDLIKNNE